MSTAVIIPTFNSCEILRRCLEALLIAAPSDHRIVVVDSGSLDGTAELVRTQFPEVTLVQGDPNLWWAGATNLGIRTAVELGSSRVITYNDDNVPVPGLFEALARAADFYPQSIISSICCYLDQPDTVFFAGRMRAKKNDRFYYLDHNIPLSSLPKGVREVELLHGMCTLFPMSVFVELGSFDHSAFPHLFADDDMILRAAKAGYSLRVTLDAVVLNDRRKTGLNPYDQALGPIGVIRLLTSRRSAFRLDARTRFLWRHRRSLWSFCKTWAFDYTRMLALVVARWILPDGAFQRAGKKWAARLQGK